MKVVFPSDGTYVVAVSGGVDSMALLHLLQGHDGADYDLIVAHFDHGIRSDSAEDRQLVGSVARQYGLPFSYEEANLGPDASEDIARMARYEFLHKLRRDHDAQAIITAHHQDDLIETAIINMARGTGRKGLTSLTSHNAVLRPLLNLTKQQVIEHAQLHTIAWREDSTNAQDSYLRNYVRLRVLPKLSDQARQQLLEIITNMHATNQEIDLLLALQLGSQAPNQLSRAWFNGLSHPVACEIVAAWLREAGVRDFSRKAIERLVVAAKVAPAGKYFDVQRGVVLTISQDHLALIKQER